MIPKEKMCGRVIVILRKQDDAFFVGSSASAIAREMGLHRLTIIGAARKAEDSDTKTYENSHYKMWVTDRFIRGKSRGGSFSY